MKKLETARRKGTMKPGYGGTWVLREDQLFRYLKGRVGIVDSAREKT